MVEFALTLLVFLALLLGILDFGRAIYMYNGVSQAAREIARVASVHPNPWPSATPGTGSAQVEEAIADQRSIILELQRPTVRCVDISGATVALKGGLCEPGNYVKVETRADYSPVTPIFNLMSLQITSSSSIEVGGGSNGNP